MQQIFKLSYFRFFSEQPIMKLTVYLEINNIFYMPGGNVSLSADASTIFVFCACNNLEANAAQQHWVRVYWSRDHTQLNRAGPGLTFYPSLITEQRTSYFSLFTFLDLTLAYSWASFWYFPCSSDPMLVQSHYRSKIAGIPTTVRGVERHHVHACVNNNNACALHAGAGDR